MAASPELIGLFERPAYLVDADRRLISANRPGERLVGAASLFAVLDGRLRCRFDSHDKLLGSTHSRVIAGGAPRLHARLVCRDRELPVVLVVARCSSSGPPAGRARTEAADTAVERVLILVHDLETSIAVGTGYVADMLSLTQAEARVATRIATGLSVQEIAAVTRVSVCTVRTQVRSILQKLGVQRQVDIVRLLSGLPGGFQGDDPDADCGTHLATALSSVPMPFRPLNRGSEVYGN